MPMMWGYGWPMMLLMGLGMLLGVILLAAVLAAVVWAVIRGLDGRARLPAPSASHDDPTGSQPWQRRQQPSALEVLRQRYARGEIDTATFEDMSGRLLASGRDGEREVRRAGESERAGGEGRHG